VSRFLVPMWCASCACAASVLAFAACGDFADLGALPAADAGDAAVDAGPAADAASVPPSEAGSDAACEAATGCSAAPATAILLFGGAAEPGPASFFGDTWEYRAGTWHEKMVPGPSARTTHMVGLATQVILFGGFDGFGGAGTTDTETWAWSGAAWTGLPIVGPDGRLDTGLSAFGDKVLLFAGATPDGTYGDTWEWSTSGWLKREDSQDPTAPQQRSGHAMVPFRGKVLLFGGYGAKDMNDTWEWDGARWTQLHPPASPAGRGGHAMAVLHDRVLLFGGTHTVDPADDDAETWEWDGATWTKRAPKTSPPRRADHAMATVGDKIVLFGGTTPPGDGGSAVTLGDTWEWDGTTWTKLSIAGPSARFGHAMASTY
jgi:Galactose oxidase, central domain